MSKRPVVPAGFEREESPISSKVMRSLCEYCGAGFVGHYREVGTWERHHRKVCNNAGSEKKEEQQAAHQQN